MSAKKFKSSQVYLERMLEHIEKVQSYLKSTTWEKFEKGGMEFDAICMQLSQLGENVNKLERGSERIVETFPNTVDWKQIKGLRNRIDHDYPWLENDKIWEAATKHLDGLKEGINEILKKRYGKEGLEINEDLYYAKIAETRLKEKRYSHEEVWPKKK